MMTTVRVIVGGMLLCVGLISLLVTYGAHLTNFISHRKRKRRGVAHEASGHVSGLPLVASLVAIPTLLITPVTSLRVVAVGMAVADLLPFVLHLSLIVLRRPSR